MTDAAARRYRLHPLDDIGVVFGLTGIQVAVTAAALIAGVFIAAYQHATAGVAVFAVGAGVGIARLNGQPALASLPAAVRWLRGRIGGRNRWYAQLPLAGGADGQQPVLPPPLAGQSLLAVSAADFAYGAGIGQLGVVHDAVTDTWAATVRVAGRRFTLLEPADQDQLVQWWGTTLAAFCAERTPVAAIRWSQWTAPAGSRQQQDYLAEHLAAQPVPAAHAAYQQLLASAGPLITSHEVLVTLSVAASRLPASRHRRDRRAAAVETLLGELAHFTRAMETAGLLVSSPLSPGDVARAVRVRLDPACAAVLDQRRRSLGESAGVVLPRNAGPLATADSWTHWQADGAYHRAFFVARWPLLEVRADWLRDLLLHAGATRTVTVSYEPVSRSASQRRVVRDAARLESDAEHRQSRGFRVGARHRRAAAAVDEREQELVAGFGELDYAGLVVVTAADPDELDRASDETVQLAASCGVELRPLDGRHDQAVAVTLPLARGLAARAVTA